MSLRENKIDIEGRSLLLNILSILFNIIGVFLLAKGFHVSSGDSSLTYIIIGFVSFLIGIFGLVALKGMYMFSFVARAFVGGLFIVSGLVKANDPWGFAFKLDEYFSPSGLAYDFPFFSVFENFTLEISILVCIAEIVLGVAVIVGGKIKLTSWSLILMMVFFTWLTYYTFSCVDTAVLLRALEANGELLSPDQQGVLSRDCVTDCGCFGDALRGSVGRSLTPYESFWKDLVLFYFVFIIFLNQRKIEINTYSQNWVMVAGGLAVVIFFSWVFGWYFPIFFYFLALLGAFMFGNMNIGKIEKPWKMAIYVAIISLLFSSYTTIYLPVKDYRPYQVGNNIIEEMTGGTAEVSNFVLLYRNKKTNEIEKFMVSEYEVYMDTSKYVFDSTEKEVIQPGVDPTIMDFSLNTDYENLTNAEKENSIIDSIINESYENYYEKKIVVSSVLKSNDTISFYAYMPFVVDTTLSKDTLFFNKISDPFYGLYNASSRFMVDMTSYILNLNKVIIITIRDIANISEGAIEDIKDIYLNSVENEIPFYILSPATKTQIELFKETFEFKAPFLAIDGTEVKILVRSNPGLILLKNANVIDKWGSKSIPEFEDIITKLK